MRSILSRLYLILFILLLAPLFHVTPATGEARAYCDAIAVGEPAFTPCMSAAGPVASATPDIDGDCMDAIRDAWEACMGDGDGDCRTRP